MKTLVYNIGELVVVGPGPVRGEAMRSPPIIEGAAVVIEAGRIAWFGPADRTPDGPFGRRIDAGGGTVVPGLVDCHTHVVFAGWREGEFVRRIEGAGYIDILEAGGGIKDSVRALRAASVEELVRQSRPRLERMLAWGSTTVEAKSGYGLTADDEIKTLDAIRRLDSALPMEIVPTFLGAHTIPAEYDGRSDAFIEAMTDGALLRRIGEGKLAEFADVFCERGAFSVEQSRRFLTACQKHGLTPKIHTEQITRSGGTHLAVDLGAASADHLELVDEEMIAALKESRTIPVVLPGCSFFLGSTPAPARRMIDAGLPVALATDCNPGSCMIESLPLIMSIGATMLGMTPLECLVACTANAAAALRRSERMGAIARGFQADLLILDIPNVNRWVYQVGVNPVAKVIKAGRVVVDHPGTA